MPTPEPQDARSAAQPRIRFTVVVTTTLEPLWYDEQWHRELVADGLTDEQALKTMVEMGVQEDPTSLLWQMFGTPPEMARGLAQSITEVCLVQ
jgi:hypothetical protein